MGHSGRRGLALLVGTTTLWATACGGGGGAPSVQVTRLPAPSPRSTAPAAAIGRPTTLPWWSAGRLHVGSVTIRTTMRSIVTRGGTTLVGRQTQHGSTWLVLRGRRLLPLVSTHLPGLRPTLSADGQQAAWTTSRAIGHADPYNADRAFTVTAYDVRRHHVTGTTVIRSGTICCDGDGEIDVAGVDNDGTVVIERYTDRGWTWRPGGWPVQLAATVAHRLDSTDQWPLGVSWTTGVSSLDPVAFGLVSTAGASTPIGRAPQSHAGLWSPDGTSFAYQPFSKLVGYPPVVWTQRGRVRLRVHHAVGVLGWESPHAVILLATSTGDGLARRTATLVRCDARSGSCEQAGPVLHHVVLPDLAG
jgi:hypothetical protein